MDASVLKNQILIIVIFMSKKPKNTNHLIHESSPYLQQHVHNPVDWYPWGEEAFHRAKKEDLPIFLSIGYATCHWCHVMEKESFSDPEIGKLMNETFVNIKVDREELPEVDSLYMEFAQSMMSGAGGWPLNLILTPDLSPFFATTYLPPKNRPNMMGLKELTERIQSIWTTDEKIHTLAQAASLVEVFKENLHERGNIFPAKTQVDDAANLLFQLADPVYGGIKGAPKFPIGYQTSFLINYSTLSQDSRAGFLAEKTLTMMQRGGIFDHLGGGFSRYSVDEKWTTPHFEKMLYDNALLAQAYLNGWQATGLNIFQSTAEKTINYVLDEMTHAEGGFFSAEDADSEGVEGKFYTWKKEEVESILGKDESDLFCQFFEISDEGNFEGRNVLHTPLSFEEFATQKQINLDSFKETISSQCNALFKRRNQRQRPFKDDKILSSWNGLMIHTLAHAGAALSNRNFIEHGIRAGNFIQQHLWKDKTLWRCWRNGQLKQTAGLDEYAFVIRAALALFQINQGCKWLSWALKLTDQLTEKFKAKDGAFYMTEGNDPHLILRKCQFSDAAEPSGNAIHCENLLNIFQITRDSRYLTEAEDILKAVKYYIDTYPPGYTYHIRNLHRYYDKKTPHLIIALNSSEEGKDVILQAIFSKCLPHKTLVWKQKTGEDLISILPNYAMYQPIDDQTTLYLCFEGSCQTPASGVLNILKQIEMI